MKGIKNMVLDYKEVIFTKNGVVSCKDNSLYFPYKDISFYYSHDIDYNNVDNNIDNEYYIYIQVGSKVYIINYYNDIVIRTRDFQILTNYIADMNKESEYGN